MFSSRAPRRTRFKIGLLVLARNARLGCKWQAVIKTLFCITVVLITAVRGFMVQALQSDSIPPKYETKINENEKEKISS